MKNKILTCLLTCGIVLLLNSSVFANEKIYYVIEHTVKQGETLDSIAAKYITKDREIKEFREGIIELNKELFFGREPLEVIPEETIKVSFWKEEECFEYK